MTVELKPLVRFASLTRQPSGAYAGRVGRVDVVATITGIGTRGAIDTTERTLEEASPDHLVVMGIAGSVDAGVPIGRVVVPEAVIDKASGREYRSAPFGGVPAGGRLLTADELITAPATLDRLRADGVVALDMETAAIAGVCDAARVPWSAFRAISDRATDGTLDEQVLALCGPDGMPDPARTARFLLRRPGQVPRLYRLGRDARAATIAAARAVVDACAGVAQ
jgi:nucleoside phosphorylase